MVTVLIESGSKGCVLIFFTSQNELHFNYVLFYITVFRTWCTMPTLVTQYCQFSILCLDK